MKTKINIASVALLIMILTNINSSYAQEQKEQIKSNDIEGFHLGGRFGLGESTINCDGLPNAVPKLAIIGGIASNYQFNKYLGINVGLLLSSLGAKNQGQDTKTNVFGAEVNYRYKERFDLLYAEVPLTGQLTFWINNFFIKGYTGPGMNFKLLASQTKQYDDSDYNNQNGYMGKDIFDANNITYSMIYGFGIGAADKQNRIFFLDFRSNRSLTSLGKINNANAFSNYYCISAGYLF